MLNNEISNRESAMLWWNNLSNLTKSYICDANSKYLGTYRRWETLTGREIEYLYFKQF